ncbi:MAG: MBL fold metallo-hydrolase, partial [Phascolarctobacterium sp.]|nr:MBL fold metallo-hydrolase [Phascolarctobacterium sp.]
MNAFKVTMLASGSKGNSALISTGKQNFLVDMGISCKMLTSRLKEVGFCVEDLDGIFLTHEHTDHVKGLATFTKKHTVPIYSSELTWCAILSKEPKIERRNCRIIGGSLKCGEVEVNSFEIPHDAVDPHGYVFKCNGSKCAYITDTGFVTPAVRQAAEDADTIILEANHDVEMLKNGIYPPHLKQRILSTRGHLSNESAGWLLANLPRLPENIILAHLSQENNLPSLALDTVRNILDGASL